MTKKKKKVSPTSRYSSVSFKVEETVLASQPKSVPVNLAEEKARFIKTGQTPRFEVQDQSKIEELASKAKNQIRFDLQGEAEYILEYVRDEYGDGELFLEHAYGSRITKEQATPIVLEYINENALSESLKIHWCDTLACSAKMVWRGPVLNANRPELRKYSLWINWSDENNYMRESGIKCLMDHEIGTHFFRLINDGFQPWFSDRTRFDLRNMGSFEGQCTEEGLASINTALRGRVRLLWSPALAYYAACKAAEMSFKELFDHLGRYTSNIDFRWKQVMRVKRGLADPRDLGGFGNDQCYFEGAVKILRNMDNIDFHLLMSGKICMDEVDRIKRVVRKDVLRLPTFLKNMPAYRKTLKKMLVLNGLDRVHNPRSAPAAFTKRLLERSVAGNISPCKTGSKKVRSKPFKAFHNWKVKVSENAATAKKSSDPRRGKDGKRKTKSKMVSPEVEKFPISTNFVNHHHLKLGEIRQREQEARTARLEQSVRENIASLSCGLTEHIEQLQSIVREHTWSNSDSGYRDSLITEASCELLDMKYSLENISLYGKQEYHDPDENTRDKCFEFHESQAKPRLPSLDINSNEDNTTFTDCGASLEDCSQPEKLVNHKSSFDFVEEEAQTVSSSLPNLKLQRQSISFAFNSLKQSSDAGSARNKLASKRRVAFPLSISSLLSSNESNSRPVSAQACLSQARDSLRSCNVDLEKGKSKGVCVLQSNEQRITSLEKNNKNSDDIDNGEENTCIRLCAASENVHNSSSATQVFIHKTPCGKKDNINKGPQVRILQREQCNTKVTQNPGLSCDKKLSGTLTGCGDPPLILRDRLSPETTLVNFRVPKLHTSVSSSSNIKSPQPTNNNNVHKAKVFITEKPTLAKNLIGERQLARLQLGSMATERYNHSVDYSVASVDNLLLVPQSLFTKQV